MSVRIPAGGLVITAKPDGKLDSSIRLQVSLDMTPYWLEIAVEHLGEAARARADLVTAQSGAQAPEVGKALEREFSAGMQAIMAGAIALDSLYASVRDRVAIPADLVETLRKKKTARHRQIAEVLRRAFRVGPRSFVNLTKVTTQLYHFRDLAVHPPADFSDPVLHPVLGSGTDWRFVSFSYDSAQAAVRAALAVVVQLVRIPRVRTGPFPDYCAALNTRLKPLVDHWKSTFGPLLEEANGQTPKPIGAGPSRD